MNRRLQSLWKNDEAHWTNLHTFYFLEGVHSALSKLLLTYEIVHKKIHFNLNRFKKKKKPCSIAPVQRATQFQILLYQKHCHFFHIKYRTVHREFCIRYNYFNPSLPLNCRLKSYCYCYCKLTNSLWFRMPIYILHLFWTACVLYHGFFFVAKRDVLNPDRIIPFRLRIIPFINAPFHS